MRAYRPSADVLFASVAENWRGVRRRRAFGDGARRGGRACTSCARRARAPIAQDKATSAVYGMPRAAAELTRRAMSCRSSGSAHSRRASSTDRQSRISRVRDQFIARVAMTSPHIRRPCRDSVSVRDGAAHRRPAVRRRGDAPAARETPDDLAFHFCADPLEAMETREPDLADGDSPGSRDARHRRPGAARASFRANEPHRRDADHRAVHEGGCAHEARRLRQRRERLLVKLPDHVELFARVRYHSRACINQRRRNRDRGRAAREPACAGRARVAAASGAGGDRAAPARQGRLLLDGHARSAQSGRQRARRDEDVAPWEGGAAAAEAGAVRGDRIATRERS